MLETDTDTLLGDGTQNGADWASDAVDATAWANGNYTFFARVQGSNLAWSPANSAQAGVGYRQVGVITGAGGAEGPRLRLR